MKRLLVGLLALCMFVSVLPLPAFATEVNDEIAEISETGLAAPQIVLGTVEGSSATLSWEPVGGAVGYKVYSSVSGTVTEIANTEDCALTVTAVAGPTNYFYVIAYDLFGAESATSNIVSVSVALEAPVFSVFQNAEGKVELTWEPVGGADSYTIVRNADGGDQFNVIESVPNTWTGYVDETAELGVAYYYLVVVNCGELSESGEPASVTLKLAAPTVDAETVESSGKIKISWNAVNGAEEYQIYRATSQTGTYSKIKTTSSTSYTDTSAEAGTKYYYQVKAVHENSAANSEYSASVGCTCDLARPSVKLSNNSTSGKIKISWSEIDGAEKYYVYRATSKTGSYSKIKTTTSTSYTDTSAAGGKTYYYKVKAVHENSSANSAYSSVKSLLCKLAKPTDLKVSKSSTSSITIKWDSVSKATKYDVYRATSKSGTYKKVATVSDEAYKDSNVTAGKTYYYKVYARCSVSSAKSSASSVISAKASLMAPEMKSSATVAKDYIKISWEKVSGASGYYVYRRESTSDSWKKIATVTSGTSYKDTDASGKQYYSVVAYKTVSGKKISGARSEAIRCRTLAKSSKVEIEGISNEFKNKVTWKKVTGATAYQVQYKYKNTSTWKTVGTVEGATSITHEVTHGKYCYYRVRPIFESNGVKSYGQYKETSYGQIHYYYPKVYSFMSDDAKSNTSTAVIYVKNNGVAPITFYTDGKWIDKDYYTFDRDVVLYDYAKFQAGSLVETSKVTIQPGETTWLLVGVEGNKTWYDRYTRIRLDCSYDGMEYTTYFSSYYGFRYSKK